MFIWEPSPAVLRVSQLMLEVRRGLLKANVGQIVASRLLYLHEAVSREAEKQAVNLQLFYRFLTGLPDGELNVPFQTSKRLIPSTEFSVQEKARLQDCLPSFAQRNREFLALTTDLMGQCVSSPRRLVVPDRLNTAPDVDPAESMEFGLDGRRPTRGEIAVRIVLARAGRQASCIMTGRRPTSAQPQPASRSLAR